MQSLVPSSLHCILSVLIVPAQIDGKHISLNELANSTSDALVRAG
jgi:hypothetical protein